jgi:quercetin dioxygenase-like cupin family protein
MKIIDLSVSNLNQSKGEKIFETRNKNARLIEFVLQKDEGIPPHLHPLGEDCALVLSGNLTYYIKNDQTLSATPGDTVFGWRNVIHGYKNLDVEPVHMLIFASPENIGLEYLPDEHPNVLHLPLEERIIHYHDIGNSKSMGFGVYENIIVDGPHTETKEDQLTYIFVDSKHKKILVAENENINFSNESQTVYLKYIVKSG